VCVRAHADAAAKRLGHPVKVAARVQTHPDEAIRYGTDVFAWAREGLVDLVIPCNFLDCADYALPLKEWKERLAAANPGVKVIPGTDNGVTKEYRNWKNRQLFTGPELRGFVERLLAQGAEGFYFFNHFDMGRATEAGRYLSVAGELDAAKIAALPRAYPVTYRDSTLNHKHAGNQLPLALAASKGRVSIASGKVPAAGTCDVLLGFGKAPPAEGLFATVSLNGVLPLRREPVSASYWLGRTPESVASFKVHYPLAALKDDVNVLEIGGVPGEADLRAVELEVFPAPTHSDAD